MFEIEAVDHPVQIRNLLGSLHIHGLLWVYIEVPIVELYYLSSGGVADSASVLRYNVFQTLNNLSLKIARIGGAQSSGGYTFSAGSSVLKPSPRVKPRDKGVFEESAGFVLHFRGVVSWVEGVVGERSFSVVEGEGDSATGDTLRAEHSDTLGDVKVVAFGTGTDC